MQLTTANQKALDEYTNNPEWFKPLTSFYNSRQEATVVRVPEGHYPSVIKEELETAMKDVDIVSNEWSVIIYQD